MKKKVVAAALCVMMTGMLTACSGTVSNDYISIKQYKGLEVEEVEQTEVTDEYVENTMNSYRGVSLDKESKAEDGDTVSLDYVGKIDGEAFEGGTAQSQSLTLGSGQYIGANGDYKGFEEQIVGHKAGETFDIEVKFPSDYPQEDYADKVAVFTVTVNGVYPEVTDEWVQTVSEKSKTVEEFKKEIRENIEKSNKEKAESQLQQSALEALLEQVEVKKLPDEQVEAEVAQMEEYYKGIAEQYELEFAEFLTTYMGMDEESFTERAKEEAETAVTRKLACELLAEKKNLEPTKEEIEEMTETYATQSGYEDVESFKEVFSDDVIKDAVLQQKVAEYLAEHCVQVEASDSSTK